MGSNAGSPKFVAVPQMTDNIGTPPQVFKSYDRFLTVEILIDLIIFISSS